MPTSLLSLSIGSDNSSSSSSLTSDSVSFALRPRRAGAPRPERVGGVFFFFGSSLKSSSDVGDDSSSSDVDRRRRALRRLPAGGRPRAENREPFLAASESEPDGLY